MPQPPAPPAPAVWTVTTRGDSLQTDTITFVASGRSRAATLFTLRVPEFRAATEGPSTRRIAVRAVVVRSTRATGDAPVVFLAGGPGDAGSRAIATMPAAMLDSLLGLGDVVAFDQRGTGRSDLLPTCRTSPLPLQGSLTREQRRDAAARDALSCVERLRAAGVRLSGWTTREIAEDLESLRVALAAPRLSLLGGSYGTHLGLAYLAAYAPRVARAVLAGVEGPDDTFKLPARVSAAFAAYAMAADADAVPAARPGLLALFDSVRTRLDRQPVDVLVGGASVTVDGSSAQRQVSDAVGDVRGLRALRVQLDSAAVGALASIARTEARRRQARPLNAMNLLVNCASGASASRRAQIERERPVARLGDVIDEPTPAMCAALHGVVAAVPPLLPPRVDAAVLFVSGAWDGRTPPSNVDALLPHFAAGRHLVVERASHSLLGDPTVWRATLQFLSGHDVPSGRVQPPATRDGSLFDRFPGA